MRNTLPALSLILFLVPAALGSSAKLVPPAVAAACGSNTTTFDVSLAHAPVAPAHPADGKATIYILQDVPEGPSLMSITVRVGMDGAWVGANRNRSWFRFAASPGVHHLCVQSQWSRLLGAKVTELHRIVAQPGKTYYFRVRFRTVGKIPSLGFGPVDEDEAQFLLETSAHAVSRTKE